jgi:hypothetical protein
VTFDTVHAMLVAVFRARLRDWCHGEGIVSA